MATPGFQPPSELQRHIYRQGQMLRGVDLVDSLADTAHLRWWHNRALHAAFGIASGLTVNILGTRVRVDPGLAYDAFGRELILRERVVVSMPAQPGDWTLVARYPEEAASSCRPPTPCWPVSERERDLGLDLVWLSTPSVRPGEVMPLLRIRGGDGELPVAERPRYRARPLARPRVASGSLDPAGRWGFWTFAVRETDTILGLEVEIDTSAAGFTTTPRYVAWTEWSRPPPAGLDLNALNLMTRGWTYVVDATPDQFRFRVLTVLAGLTVKDLLDVITGAKQPGVLRDHVAIEIPGWLRALDVIICWLGVEHEPVAGFPSSEGGRA
jgi:hypothetical protein